MTKFIALLRIPVRLIILVIGLTILFAPAVAQACTTSWSKSQYKSYAQVQSEVRSRVGNARVLSVELCGSGASAYFRVVVLTENGAGATRHELRISGN